MSLLLDTHVLLWVLMDDARLPAAARTAIEDGRTRVLVSAVSPWEITIKAGLGKLRAPDDLLRQIAALRFEELDVTFAHALAVADLPDHHADPFDRLLIAQARTERLTLVTSDPAIRLYDVTVLAG